MAEWYPKAPPSEILMDVSLMESCGVKPHPLGRTLSVHELAGKTIDGRGRPGLD